MRATVALGGGLLTQHVQVVIAAFASAAWVGAVACILAGLAGLLLERSPEKCV